MQELARKAKEREELEKVLAKIKWLGKDYEKNKAEL